MKQAEFAQNSKMKKNSDADILLNNFRINKKKHRVLLNYDHIVWEQLDAKQAKAADKEQTIKEAELETERLSNRANYSVTSNVLHLNEIFRVVSGNTAAATRNLTDVAALSTSTSAAEDAVEATVKAPATAQYLTIYYAERIVKSATDCNRWHVRLLTLYNSDVYVIERWHALLNKLLEQSTSTRLRLRRLLVFVNPFGGRKKGLKTFEKHCKPLFRMAGIDAPCIISQRANQIRDILMCLDLSLFDAVCCVGGDGTVAEVINGLIFRAMRDLGMEDMRTPAYIPKPALPIGVIPAGSTDTIAYSLHGTSDARTAAIHLILGQRRGLDICSVRNREGLLRFCASVMSYGYLGDVAAKSEKYRWMGTKRYEFVGVKSFLLNQAYQAEIRMQVSAETVEDEVTELPNSVDSTVSMPSSMNTICYVNCKRCSSALEQKLSNADDDDDELPTCSNLSLCAQTSHGDVDTDNKLTNYNDVAVDDNDNNAGDDDDDDSIRRNINFKDCDRLQVKQKQRNKDLNIAASAKCDNNDKPVTVNNDATNGQLFALSGSCSSITDNNNQAQTNEWKIIKGKYFMISGTNISCACIRSPNGISRYNHLGDGNMELILVKKTSLFNNLRFAINTMGRKGDIRKLPFVIIHRTRQFYFTAQPSAMQVDSESVRGSCQPITDALAVEHHDDNSSSWNCDGEVVNELELIMSSHCQLIDVFMRGPYDFNCNDKIKQAGNSLFCCWSSNN